MLRFSPASNNLYLVFYPSPDLSDGNSDATFNSLVKELFTNQKS